MSKLSMMSRFTTGDGGPNGGRHIACISGGVASAWVAKWVEENIDGEKIYYFNDTRWEHPDLYRFLGDLELALGIEVTNDSDGRTPEEVFYDEHMLGNNRVPICSRILKADRLQNFCRSGDVLYFGIDRTEIHRAARITPIYARLGCECRFPLIDNEITREQVFFDVEALGIKIPQMYLDGFTHNNCSGGCVRAGKRQWVSLLRVYPDVYLDRERIEKEASERFGKRMTFMKDISLSELRAIIESQGELDFGEDDFQGECIGICERMY